MISIRALALFGKLGTQWQRDERQAVLLLLPACLTLCAYTSILPIWAMISLIGFSVWRLFLIVKGKRLPHRLLLIPLTVLMVVLVFIEYKTILSRESGVVLLLLMLGLKQLELRAKRDTYIVLVLCFLAIFCVLFYSQSLLMTIYLMVCIFSTILALVSVQYHTHEAALSYTFKLSAQLFVSALPVAIILFFIFPRFDQPLWALPNTQTKAKMGMSDEMAVGDIQQLSQSDEIVFRVKFLEDIPSQSNLYWRGLVLDGYDGRRWFASGASHRVDEKFSTSTIRALPSNHWIQYQMTLEPSQTKWIYPLELPSHQSNQLLFNAEMMLYQTKERLFERQAFDLVAFSAYEYKTDPNSKILKNTLWLPKNINPKTQQLAQELWRNSGTPQRFVQSVLNYFRQNQFSYTLEPPPLGVNGVDDFLLKTKAGFCEHYAQAFVVLARNAGIPARVVVGYQGGEFNSVDSTLVVRQADAHAWTEVWYSERGWVRIDPTAAVDPSRIARSEFLDRREQLDAPVLGSVNTAWVTPIRHTFEAINNAWVRWVVNYDAKNQQNIFSQLGWKGITPTSLMLLLIAILGMIAAWIAWRVLRIQIAQDPLEINYDKMLKWIMVQYRLTKKPQQGAASFCDDLYDKIKPSHYALIQEITTQYYRAKYANQITSERIVAIQSIKRLLKKLRHTKS